MAVPPVFCHRLEAAPKPWTPVRRSRTVGRPQIKRCLTWDHFCMGCSMIFSIFWWFSIWLYIYNNIIYMGIYGFSMIFSYFSGWNDEIPQFLVGWTPTLCGWKIRGNHDVWWVHGSRVFFLRMTSPTSPILVVIHIFSFLGWFVFPMCVANLLSLVEIFSKLVSCAVYSPSWAGAAWSKPGKIRLGHC